MYLSDKCQPIISPYKYNCCKELVDEIIESIESELGGYCDDEIKTFIKIAEAKIGKIGFDIDKMIEKSNTYTQAIYSMATNRVIALIKISM